MSDIEQLRVEIEHDQGRQLESVINPDQDVMSTADDEKKKLHTRNAEKLVIMTNLSKNRNPTVLSKSQLKS